MPSSTKDRPAKLSSRRIAWVTWGPSLLLVVSSITIAAAFESVIATDAMYFCLGIALARLPVPSLLRQHFFKGRDPVQAQRVIAADLVVLKQAFEVLQSQVNATIQSSESAVMAMGGRLGRVHQQIGQLAESIEGAVERSSRLSSDSLQQAGQHAAAVTHLARHQSEFDQTRHQILDRVGQAAHQVRQLTPLAELISGIARQTNLLAINAAIEAARAGPEGAGFKVVAAEVRRLSNQAADAAQQVTHGIEAAAQAVDEQVVSLQESIGDRATEKLDDIAEHIQTLSSTLGEVLPYLQQLSTDMEAGVGQVNTDIVDTLGDMQFQDINRQLLEQIHGALGSLSQHSEQLYQLIDGDAPPPPILLEELLEAWSSSYVMHAQRVAHQKAMGLPVDEHEPATPEGMQLATHQGPRIELF